MRLIALPGVGISGGQASVAGRSSVLEQKLLGHQYFETRPVSCAHILNCSTTEDGATTGVT